MQIPFCFAVRVRSQQTHPKHFPTMRAIAIRRSGLEDELQRKLDGAAAPRTNDGVGTRSVRGFAAATESARRRRIVESQAILAPKGIGKVGMIEEVEDLGAELRCQAFLELEILGNGKIPVVETRVPEGVAAHRAEGPKGWRNHDRAALRVAAKRRERRRRTNGRSLR